MEHMNPLDAAFWQLEDTHAALHIAGIAVFAGPPPGLAEVRRLYARKLHLVPRLRQRMRPVRFGLGRPAWVDDPSFDLSYHLRHTAVPAPGTERQLATLVGRLVSNHLDPERPLWEAWLVDGLQGNRWAIVTKLHHSMLDGVSGMSMLSKVFDSSPTAKLPPPDRWAPPAEPGTTRLIASALRDEAVAAGAALRGAAACAAHPARSVGELAALTKGVRQYATALRPNGRTELCGPLHSARRYRTATVELADIAQVRSQLGGSVNDVVLAIVTAGLRDLLAKHGERPAAHLIRSLVPVSVRSPADHDELDNQVSALLADLPVEFTDPVDCYEAVVARTRQLKASHEAEAGRLLTGLARYLPPPLLTAALSAAFRVPQRAVTTVVTNIPGPALPRYALGRRMLANYPYVPIADQVRVGIAVTSYDGRLYFGITSDRDSVPDVDVLREGIERGLADLLAATGSRRLAQ
jgi:WS/DGAT/MGAT family acyltransferase